MKFLILGYGNPLRGDDGVGWAAIERLEKLEGHLADADLLALHQLTPELAERLSVVRGAILIDAAVDLPPGQIRRQEIDPNHGLPEMMHDLSPQQLAGMARGLYGQCSPVVLFTVGGACWEMTQALSPPVAAALVGLTEQVLQQIRDWSSEHA